MGFFEDFIGGVSGGLQLGQTFNKGFGQDRGAFSGYDRGTKTKFDRFVTDRQASVSGAFNEYKKDADFWSESAKTLAGLAGEGASAKDSLTGLEFAAQVMKGKSQTAVTDYINKFKALRDEGKSIRSMEGLASAFKRGENTQEIRNLTAADIAKMQMGGGFSYPEQKFNFGAEESFGRRFLRENLGLFTESTEDRTAGFMAEQRRRIRSGLPNYDKYAATDGSAPIEGARRSIDLSGRDLRTQEAIDIQAKTSSEARSAAANAAKAEHEAEVSLHSIKGKTNALLVQRARLVTQNASEEEIAAIDAEISELHTNVNRRVLDARVEATYTDAYNKALTLVPQPKLRTNPQGGGNVFNQGGRDYNTDQINVYKNAVGQAKRETVFNVVLNTPENQRDGLTAKSFGASAGLLPGQLDSVKDLVEVLESGNQTTGRGASIERKIIAGLGNTYGESTSPDSSIEGLPSAAGFTEVPDDAMKRIAAAAIAYLPSDLSRQLTANGAIFGPSDPDKELNGASTVKSTGASTGDLVDPIGIDFFTPEGNEMLKDNARASLAKYYNAYLEGKTSQREYENEVKDTKAYLEALEARSDAEAGSGANSVKKVDPPKAFNTEAVARMQERENFRKKRDQLREAESVDSPVAKSAGPSEADDAIDTIKSFFVRPANAGTLPEGRPVVPSEPKSLVQRRAPIPREKPDFDPESHALAQKAVYDAARQTWEGNIVNLPPSTGNKDAIIEAGDMYALAVQDGFTTKQATTLAAISAVEAAGKGWEAVEKGNYTTDRLIDLRDTGELSKLKGSSNAAIKALVKGGERDIFNKIYGGRMGNNEKGDGYKYRGRGYIMLTGKNNYKQIGDIIGVDLVDKPDLLVTDKKVARLATLAFMRVNAGYDATPERMIGVVGGTEEGKKRKRALLKALLPKSLADRR